MRKDGRGCAMRLAFILFAKGAMYADFGKKKNATMFYHDSVFWRIQEGSNLRPAA